MRQRTPRGRLVPYSSIFKSPQLIRDPLLGHLFPEQFGVMDEDGYVIDSRKHKPSWQNIEEVENA